MTADRLIELSHVIHAGMTTYPGLPGPEITDHLSREASREHYAPGTEFHIGRLSMVANTGTYLDTPFHRYPDTPDLSDVELSKLVDLDGVVVPLPADQRAADVPLLEGHEVDGKAVLIHSGWDRHWGTESYGSSDHPYLTADGAAWLVEQQAVMVGIDSVNIDDIADPARPAHSRLLAAGIPIIEHMRGLSGLPRSGFRLHAAPPMVAGLGTFPVRAYAVLG